MAELILFLTRRVMYKTVSLTFSTRRVSGRYQQGFTLVELLISAGLSSFILVGVLMAFLMIGRVSKNLQSYTEIEGSARKALEVMGREIRLALYVTGDANNLLLSTCGTSVTLSMPDSSANATAIGYTVTYTYDTASKTITRTGPPIYDPTGSSTTSTLVRDVEPISGSSVFFYYRYVNSNYLNSYTDGYQNNAVTSPTPISAVQQMEVKFLLKKQWATEKDATNRVLSAQFVLRNKRS